MKTESAKHKKGQHKNIEEIVPSSLLEKINIRKGLVQINYCRRHSL